MKLSSFSLPITNFTADTLSNEDFSKGTYVIFIYPKDMTSGCTIESQNFRDLKPDFDALNIQIFGLSKDSDKSHCKFIEKESLNYPLIVDEESKLIDGFGSWIEKSMYGRKYMGADRSTFIIKDGVVIQEWRKVKVSGHAEEVLAFCNTL